MSPLFLPASLPSPSLAMVPSLECSFNGANTHNSTLGGQRVTGPSARPGVGALAQDDNGKAETQ